MVKNEPKRGTTMPRVNLAFDPISAALLQLHQAVASEEVPDEFLKILDDIDAKIAAAKISTQP